MGSKKNQNMVRFVINRVPKNSSGCYKTHVLSFGNSLSTAFCLEGRHGLGAGGPQALKLSSESATLGAG
jgi:hypothetical protein